MTTPHMSASETVPGTLPLKIELRPSTYAALDQIAALRGTEGRALAAQLIEHAVQVSAGKQPEPPSAPRGQNGHVTDEELIRIHNHNLALARIPNPEIARQLGLPNAVVKLYVDRLRPNPRSRAARELGLAG